MHQNLKVNFMNPIRRKFISALGQQGWRPPAGAGAQLREQANSEGGSLASEYQDWARWLDSLRQAASGGQMPALRALAHGKLRFLLRRSLLLRDNTMLGIRHHAQLAEAGSLIREFAQLMGELTGRPMPAEDEWPLPARLYDAAHSPSPATNSPGERRQQPGRQNRLDAISLDLAQQIHNSLQLTLRLLQQHGSLAGSRGMQQAANQLAHAAELGRLHQHDT